jgi:hypothetical protein
VQAALIVTDLAGGGAKAAPPRQAPAHARPLLVRDNEALGKVLVGCVRDQ